HLYRAFAYDTGVWNEIEKMADKPGALLGEIVLNGLMFKYLGNANANFEKYFEKGLETVARRNVLARLGAAAADGEGSLLFDKAVVEEAAALRNNLGVKALKFGTGLAYESVKFQQWEFYMQAGRLALAGDKDAISHAAKIALSPKSLAHSFLFLFGLKTAELGKMPVTEKIERFTKEAIYGKDFDKPLLDVMVGMEGAGKDLNAYLETGKGNPAEILKNYESVLRDLGDVVEKMPHASVGKDFIDAYKRMVSEAGLLKRGLVLFD